VVRVPAKWQGNAGENERKLLYMKHANNDLVLPTRLALSGSYPFLEHGIRNQQRLTAYDIKDQPSR